MDRSDIFNLATQNTTVTKTPTIGEMFRDILTQAGEAAKNLVYEKSTAEIARLQRRQTDTTYPSAVSEPVAPTSIVSAIQDSPVMVILLIIILFAVFR